MQIRWRKNPKTEEGWFKRIAISLLVGVAGFAVGFPAAFFLMVEYLRRTRPGDTENFLGAMTGAVVVGLGVAGLGFFAAMAVLVAEFSRETVGCGTRRTPRLKRFFWIRAATAGPLARVVAKAVELRSISRTSR